MGAEGRGGVRIPAFAAAKMRGAVFKGAAIAGIEIGFAGQTFGQHDIMAIQFEMEIAHAVRRVGRGDGGAIDQMLGWDQHPFEIETVIGRYG